MKIKIQDRVIFADQLAADPEIFDSITRLQPGDGIRLSVDGIHGAWRKAPSTGRPSGERLIPVGAMITVWDRLQVKRGSFVELKLLSTNDQETDEYLSLIDGLMPEWNSAEDEEAFGGLRPL